MAKLSFIAACLAAALAAASCASQSGDLRLRRVILYRNGLGYFEQSGSFDDDELALDVRRSEVDDVLQTLTVIEQHGAAQKRGVVSVLPPVEDTEEGARADASEPVRVGVRFATHTRRRLAIGYATPTPTWIASYRLVVPPRRGEGLLQAWAMVHNASSRDWNRVALSLATSGPLSFALNLRTPRFVSRPDVTDEFAGPLAYGAVFSERREHADTDHDGILDSTDSCADAPEECPDVLPNGRAAAAVRAEAADAMLITEKVFFDRDSSATSPSARPIVEAIARALLGNRAIEVVELVGHATSDEHDPWWLATERASAVRRLLVDAGVGAQRLRVVSRGDSQPLDTAPTQVAKARNRRVEIVIAQVGAVGGSGRGGGGGAAPSAGAITASALDQADRARSIATTDGTRYDLRAPVSIPAGGSALLSILSRRIPVEPVLLYRDDASVPESASHPFRAARIDNRTGADLLAGPVALFAHGAFAGEGLLRDLHAGDTALVPYGLDRATVVEVSQEESQAPLRLVSIVRGVMTVLDASIRRTRYAISAGARAPERILVHHVRAPGFEPRDLPAHTDVRADSLLVPLAIAPRRSSVLTIEERAPIRRDIAIADDHATDLRVYLHGDAIPSELRARIDQVLSVRADLGRADEDAERSRIELADVADESAQTREALRSIEHAGGAAAALRRQLLEQLSRATARGGDLSRRLVAIRARQAELRVRLADLVRGLRLD